MKNIKLIIESTKREKEIINYSKLSFHELNNKILFYENKYKKTYDEFLKDYDCGEASMEESFDESDWQCLLEEKVNRILSDQVKVIITSGKSKKISQLAKNVSLIKFYETTIKPLEKQGFVKYE